MQIVIVGNGMVSYKICEKWIAKSTTKDHQITVFGEELDIAYDRVHLSNYIAGSSKQDLSLANASWYRENGIVLNTGDPIVSIDRDSKQILSYKGIHLEYDILILATGSAAFVPSIPGVDKKGVFVYRTLEDLDMISAYAKKSKNAAVIGGGLLGLEAAKAMLDLGISDTSVIEFASKLMPRQIDDTGSKILQNKLESLGLKIYTNKNTAKVLGEDQITGLEFTDGSKIDINMLVISAGIKPRDELAKACGLETGPRGGIVVNELLQTSGKNIYAAGECALYNNMIYGLVAPGYEMAEVIVSNILLQANKTFNGFDMSTKLKLIGVDVASFGDPFAIGDDIRSIIIEDNHRGVYKRINISESQNILLGGILIGDAEQYNILLQNCKNKLSLPARPEELIMSNKNDSESGAGINNLPDEALICSCESISKGAICLSVSEQNCESLEAIKKCTKAGTGCGGCIPMLKDLMQYTMKAQGKYIRNVLCEHFNYSRQELFDLVKLEGLKTYDEVLSTFGKGHGCEICKPPVASILASLWNEMPLVKGNATAQDSNDRYLANIQKGGTYSVVPRIPGGEITPEKLILIGEIAKKYELYTKITGGQRIDLFGAHVGDLPDIWAALIAGGFESGHAYGKALRTVKSCVGSTWCRFGLHDSVSYAIRIEERYRGLRAPHKLKSAVSGCIRECAEAQSKDFGIIATEKGWNLYVCGNGGSKPQHAILLATDLDSETCIQYIDRFLMFYIKTADPLTRTATWLNKMEGGIDYLRNVVVNDSLGMAAQWEQDMENHVRTYRCEWKDAIENIETKKRFSHFVNAPNEKDPSVRFDKLREQKKAMEWK